jgi:hypothetical protein
MKTLNAQRSTLNAQRSTLNAQRSTLNAQRSTLNAQRTTLNAQRSTHKCLALIFAMCLLVRSATFGQTYTPVTHPWLPDEFSDNSSVKHAGANMQPTTPSMKQLQYDYPAPRYHPKSELLPNVPLYAHVNEIDHNGLSQPINNQQKIDIALELSRNWNYYFPVSDVWADGLSDANTYVPGTGNVYAENALWIATANANPELPRSLGTNLLQIRRRLGTVNT